MPVVRVVRTVKLRFNGLTIAQVQALDATAQLWAAVVEFYRDVFVAKSDQTLRKAFSRTLRKWAEDVTIRRPGQQASTLEWDFTGRFPGVPKDFRRAAILEGLRLARLLDFGAKHGRMSVPRPGASWTVFQEMRRLDLPELRRGCVQIKLFDGETEWRWFQLQVALPPYAEPMFAESARERERIRVLRAEQRRQMSAEGRRAQTPQERVALQSRMGVWTALSPTVVRTRDGYALDVPFQARVQVAGKAEELRLTQPLLRVGTVDLNTSSVVAAAWEGQRCLGIRTFWLARENAKREKALEKVARKQRRSGRPVKGERSNVDLWRYIRNLDNAVAWQVAAAIVAWAAASRLEVLVFEHLRSYHPERGPSWSRRANRKRSYWLRGRVLAHVRHLALCHGILTVERNPAWTSRACPRCGRLGERFSPTGRGYPSRFRCGHCGWEGDANVVAALNLKRKWDRTFRYPTAEEQAAERSRRRKAGAAARREGAPETVGANA